MPSYVYHEDGTVSVRYDLPRDPLTGKRRQRRSPRFPSEAEARAWMERKQRELDAGRGLYDDGITLAEYAALWLTRQEGRVERGRLRAATLFGYKQHLRLHILPHLGHYRLAELSPERIVAWHDALALETGLSPGTVYRLHGTLHQILADAAKRGAVEGNAAAGAWPERGKRRPPAWSVAEIHRFIDWCDRNETSDPVPILLFRTALVTGLRLGELLALEWSDLDLAARKLSVRRTQTRDADGNWRTGPPKTAAGARTITLPEGLVAHLRAHRAAQLRERLELGHWASDLVFAQPLSGRPYHRVTLRTRLHRCCDAAGVPRVSPHQLRRAAATWMVSLGMHPRIIQARLGHEHVTMSMDIYAYAAEDLDAGAADLYDEDQPGPMRLPSGQ